MFVTRHPFFPNHLGISIAKLVSREGNRLQVLGVDMLDQSPLLNIKPYIPDVNRRISWRSG